jgi:uridine kinase
MMEKKNTKFLPIIEELKSLIKENKSLIIAIDGRCGSGKSTLAALIKKTFDCNVFHMDDYFLPFNRKTPKRLSEPGGNVDYERFHTEVLIPLQNGEDVIYRPYNCTKGTLDEPINVMFKNVNIVEGSYSLHPTLIQAYDYKIFLTLDSKIQQERILRRNGEEMLQNFINKWIPMEEYYFSALNIQEQCDIVFDTTYI